MGNLNKNRYLYVNIEKMASNGIQRKGSPVNNSRFVQLLFEKLC